MWTVGRWRRRCWSGVGCRLVLNEVKPNKTISAMTINRRKQLLADKLGSFVQQYGRKAQKGVEPNDRRYSEKLEEVVKHLPPEELSELLSGDEVRVVSLKRKKKVTKPDPFNNEVKRKR